MNTQSSPLCSKASAEMVFKESGRRSGWRSGVDLNAPMPMTSSEAGKSTCWMLLPWKALSPISVMPSGMVISVIFDEKNRLPLIVFNPSGNSMDSSCSVRLNALVPISVTPSGIPMVLRAFAFLNACGPMVFKLSGRLTVSRFSLSQKRSCGSSLIPSGMVMCVNASICLNASGPMVWTLAGISTVFKAAFFLKAPLPITSRFSGSVTVCNFSVLSKA